tara:strand:+ start:671 stop:1183 length:513 start_codon:yes stop_codon:yes gene_type:complete
MECIKLDQKIKERKIYDVLIWNDKKSEMEEPDDPTGMVNVTREYSGLTRKEAYKIYNNSKSYYKQLIKYESEDEDANGDIIEEEENTFIGTGLKEFVTLKELKDEGERIDNKIERFFESGKSKKYDNKVMNLFSDIYDDLTNKGFTDTQSMRILQSIVYQAQLNYDIAVD